MKEKPKPITPYRRLKDAARKFAASIEYAPTRRMWTYPKDKLGHQWKLEDLWERTKAAEQIGYDVVLEAHDTEGLIVRYRKKPDQTPYEIRS